MDRKRVVVIFGGQSLEHEVSRVSAQSVIDNLDKNKYEVTMVGITKEGEWLNYNGPTDKLSTGEWQTIAKANKSKIHKNTSPEENNPSKNSLRDFLENISTVWRNREKGKPIDVVFPVLHGSCGEDGTIQGFFELADIPYVGCGVLGSALGMDKYYSKVIFEKANIPQGKFFLFDRSQIEEKLENILLKIEKELTYPCFVKPCNSGSSVGVSKPSSRSGLIDAINTAIKYDNRILVEEYIQGQEVECSVLGNREPVASTVGEIIPCNEFYDYKAKYSEGSMSEILIPARSSSQEIETIKRYAVKAFKVLDCSGLARVDFFIQEKTGKVLINEINTMPGFTQISMYPKLWNASGLPYPRLLDKLIDLAIEKHKEKKKISRWL